MPYDSHFPIKDMGKYKAPFDVRKMIQDSKIWKIEIACLISTVSEILLTFVDGEIVNDKILLSVFVVRVQVIFFHAISQEVVLVVTCAKHLQNICQYWLQYLKL